MSYGNYNQRDRHYNDRPRRYQSSRHHTSPPRGYSPYSRGYGGGGRGRGRARGGYRGRGRARAPQLIRYSEPNSQILVQSVTHIWGQLNDKSGVHPLRTFHDLDSNIKYEEARYRDGYCAKVDMKTNKATLVKTASVLSQTDHLMTKLDEARWLNGIPKKRHEAGHLQFETITNIISNSLPVKNETDGRIMITQFTFNATVKDETIIDPDIKQSLFMASRRRFRPALMLFDKMHLFAWGEGFSPSYEFTVNINIGGSRCPYLVTVADPSSSEVGAINPSFRKTALSIVNRSRFSKVGFNKLFRSDEIYYNLKNPQNMMHCKQNGDLKYPHLTLLKGYKSTLAYAANEQLIVKTAVHHKLITADPVSHFLKSYQARDAEGFIVGKNAITNYGHSRIKDKICRDQMVKIDAIDWNMNLQSTFTKSGGTEITFYEYFVKEKGLVLRYEHEEAMIVMHRYKRGSKTEIESTKYFPPQLVHIIVRNEEITEPTKKLVRLRSHPTAEETCTEVVALNELLNKACKSKVSKLFETVIEPIVVTGYRLNPPFICFYGYNNQIMKHDLHTFGGRQWSGVKAVQFYGEMAGRDWVIYYDGNMGQEGMQNAENIRRLFKQFLEKRRFDQPPLAPPHIQSLNYQHMESIRMQVRNPKYCVSLFIIGADMNGSKHKIQISKHALMSGRMRDNVETPAFHSNINHDIGFILSCNTMNRNAAFGVFESLFLKAGLGLYTVDSNLPCGVFNTDAVWFLSIKIYKKGDLKVAIFNCNTRPFEGQLKYTTTLWFPLPIRCDVIPQSLMKQFMRQMMHRCIAKDANLPNNLIVIRQGGGDSLFAGIISKEIAGIKKQLSVLAKDKQLTKKHRYYPGVIFIVLQENVMDAFGRMEQNRVMMIKESILINNPKITGADYLDAYLSIAVKQEGAHYCKIARLILLMDEYNEDSSSKPRLKLRTQPKLISDLYQLIYAQTYLYAPNIPFSKRPTIPAGVSNAVHAGKWITEMILKDDDLVSDLQLNGHLVNTKPRLLEKGN